MGRLVPLLHLHGSPFPGGYTADGAEPWAQGEVRRVKPKVAAYLAATFPGAFGPPPEGATVLLDPEAIDPDGPAEITPIPDHRDERIAELEQELAAERAERREAEALLMRREAEIEEARALLAEARAAAAVQLVQAYAELPPIAGAIAEPLPPEPTEG